MCIYPRSGAFCLPVMKNVCKGNHITLFHHYSRVKEIEEDTVKRENLAHAYFWAIIKANIRNKF